MTMQQLSGNLANLGLACVLMSNKHANDHPDVSGALEHVNEFTSHVRTHVTSSLRSSRANEDDRSPLCGSPFPLGQGGICAVR